MNTMTFVASATALSSRSDDDAMSVTSWRRSDKEIDAVPPPPFGLMGVAGDLCVARRRRCPCIAFSWLLDLASQAPSANVIVFMGQDTREATALPPSFFDPSRFTLALSQIVEFCTSDPSPFDHLDRLDGGRVERKNPLNPVTH